MLTGKNRFVINLLTRFVSFVYWQTRYFPIANGCRYNLPCRTATEVQAKTLSCTRMEAPDLTVLSDSVGGGRRLTLLRWLFGVLLSGCVGIPKRGMRPAD